MKLIHFPAFSVRIVQADAKQLLITYYPKCSKLIRNYDPTYTVRNIQNDVSVHLH